MVQKTLLRQPIVVVLGHVDHGKTTLLDKIRGTAVAVREVGGMTQHIGSSFFPLNTLKEICGPVLKKFRAEIEIPGLLVIDTPGHEAFFNLRKRGGSVADIAILVIDVVRGMEVQTYESLEILRSRKTPFLIAANKVDLIPGWKSVTATPFLESLKNQDPFVRKNLDDKLYTMIGALSRLGFKADRFDRVEDFTKFVAIVPVSAKTGEGIPELLSVLIGLTQQYLQSRLLVSEGPAKGTVLEVKEEVGLGVTLNTIIYDGVLKEGDTVVLGGKEKPIITKVRAILLPKPLDEMRDPKDKFTPASQVSAAIGVKIVAPNLEDTLAGTPIYAVGPAQDPNQLATSITEEIEHVKIKTDKIGVIVKADALGSLEAIINQLNNYDFPIRRADIGNISKQDVTEAATVKKESPLHGVILAFNVKMLPGVEEEMRTWDLKIFQSNIVYRLIEDYAGWVKSEQEARIQKEFEILIKPGKIQFLPNFIFRRSEPAIIGIKVLSGTIKPGYKLMKPDSEIVGEIMQIQDKGQTIQKATTGMEVAISMKEPVVGRNVKEGETFYVSIPEDHARSLLTMYQSKLTHEEIETLEEIKTLMRKKYPYWLSSL